MASDSIMRIAVKLDETWVEEQETYMEAIDEIIKEFTLVNKSIRAVQKDKVSCIFECDYIEGSKGTVEREFLYALEEALGLMPDSDYIEWKSGVYHVNDPRGAHLNIPEKMWKVEVEFDDVWVLDRRTDDVLPIENFIKRMEEEIPHLTIDRESLTKCTLIVSFDEGGKVKQILNVVLSEMGAMDAAIVQTVERHQPGAAPAGDSKAKDEKKEPTLASQIKIEGLIGMQEFKKLAQEIIMVTPQIIKHHTKDAFTNMCYLFSIGDGCGLTTQANLFAELLHELELFTCSSTTKASESNKDESLSDLTSTAEGYGNPRRVVVLDISTHMDKVRTPDFRNFLQHILDCNQNQILIFRIPYVDEDTRRKVFAAISDVYTVREVVTTPYTTEELKEFADKIIKSRRFSMDDGAWKRFEQRIIDEKSDGHFYGMNTVRKICDEMIYQKNLSAAKNSECVDEKMIEAENVPIYIGESLDERPAMEQLEELVGIEAIRSRILEVMAQIKVSSLDDTMRPCLHMRFVGAPGTGKTTVARILGKLMKEQKILSKGQFFEYAGRDFCGQYIGETAPKTGAMCRDAYGSVLFIDEAYSLFRGDKDNRDFGREAIDTLIAQMENHRKDFMVIMAGYTDDMKIMMEGNVGLASRMPYTIEFPNYGKKELYEIFMKMVKKSFPYEAELDSAAKHYFDTLGDGVLADKEFANARFVRNLFERTWGKASVRHQLEPDKAFEICACDFDKAAADREFAQLQQRTSRRIGF